MANILHLLRAEDGASRAEPWLPTPSRGGRADAWARRVTVSTACYARVG